MTEQQRQYTPRQLGPDDNRTSRSFARPDGTVDLAAMALAIAVSQDESVPAYVQEATQRVVDIFEAHVGRVIAGTANADYAINKIIDFGSSLWGLEDAVTVSEEELLERQRSQLPPGLAELLGEAA